MTTSELKHLYFEWMRRLVCDRNHHNSYEQLLEHLFKRQYFYENQLPHDINRADDGIDLRYQFAYEEHFDYPRVASELDMDPCSMLEMMVALARRCEDYESDPRQGDRTGYWFWLMVYNLGLEKMDDNHYDPAKVDAILYRFFDNDYTPDGMGSLFYIPNTRIDLRREEIWNQMTLYLHTYCN